MAAKVFDSLGLALWLVGFGLLTLGFLLGHALAALLLGARTARAPARADVVADRTPACARIAEG